MRQMYDGSVGCWRVRTSGGRLLVVAGVRGGTFRVVQVSELFFVEGAGALRTEMSSAG